MIVSELLKLEKIEFGGIKGKALGELVVQMYAQFQETLSKFTGSSLNPLDLGNKVHTHLQSLLGFHHVQLLHRPSSLTTRSSRPSCWTLRRGLAV